MTLALGLTGDDVLAAARQLGVIGPTATLSSLTVPQKIDFLSTLADLRAIEFASQRFDMARQALELAKLDNSLAADFLKALPGLLGVAPPA